MRVVRSPGASGNEATGKQVGGRREQRQREPPKRREDQGEDGGSTPG